MPRDAAGSPSNETPLEYPKLPNQAEDLRVRAGQARPPARLVRVKKELKQAEASRLTLSAPDISKSFQKAIASSSRSACRHSRSDWRRIRMMPDHLIVSAAKGRAGPSASAPSSETSTSIACASLNQLTRAPFGRRAWSLRPTQSPRGRKRAAISAHCSFQLAGNGRSSSPASGASWPCALNHLRRQQGERQDCTGVTLRDPSKLGGPESTEHHPELTRRLGKLGDIQAAEAQHKARNTLAARSSRARRRRRSRLSRSHRERFQPASRWAWRAAHGDLRQLMVDYRARAWWNLVASLAPMASCR